MKGGHPLCPPYTTPLESPRVTQSASESPCTERDIKATITTLVTILNGDPLVHAHPGDLVERMALPDHPLQVLRVQLLQPDNDLARLPRGDGTGHSEAPLLANAALLVHVVLLPRLEHEAMPGAKLLLSQLCKNARAGGRSGGRLSGARVHAHGSSHMLGGRWGHIMTPVSALLVSPDTMTYANHSLSPLCCSSLSGNQPRSRHRPRHGPFSGQW